MSWLAINKDNYDAVSIIIGVKLIAVEQPSIIQCDFECIMQQKMGLIWFDDWFLPKNSTFLNIELESLCRIDG